MKKINFVFFILLYSLVLKIFAMNLTLQSSAFNSNTMIPSQYTCEGENISPPLFWTDKSTQTKSYVLTVDDPDAPNGDWVHWVLFNIPATVKQLSDSAATPEGAINGLNSWGVAGYGGPCPPTGTHRYFFKLYALDTVLRLDSSVTLMDVRRAISSHIIANSELIGLYRKK